MAELLVDNKNRIFSFDGSLGAQAWEPSPVTRFRFKKPQPNEWFKERLKANYPTCGIVFEGVPHIGTSDGFIYTPDKKIQRVPEILVDPEIFIDEYQFANEKERKLFRRFKSGDDGIREVCALGDRGLIDRVAIADEKFRKVEEQERNIDRYLQERFSHLSIIGLAVDKRSRNTNEPAVLYDGSRLGIYVTESGVRVNPLVPHRLYQLSSTSAGMVPSGDPFDGAIVLNIKDGIETREIAHCVDHRSLWTLDGRGMFVQNICPRDGSGCSAGDFATDGRVSAICHGNGYRDLDIRVVEGNGTIIERRIKNVDPMRLMIRDSQVYGFNADNVKNYTTGETVFDGHHILSVSDSGLCAVAEGDRTLVYNPFTRKPVDSIAGSYKFLSATLK